jgi:hypothetical protein
MAEMVAEADSTAWKVMTRSFRPNLNPIQARLAFLETVSHLEHLRIIGRVEASEREGKTLYTA